ncbi:MAG TPA: 30S ribosomal protein S1, partial [Chitinophagaceae bacterium]
MSENNIVNQNADAQESASVETTDVATATPNLPVQTAHDDFDWSVDKRNVTSYTEEEREKYHNVYDKTFVQLNDGELINGTVVGLTKTDVVLNIGFKSDGLISLNEFRDLQGLKIGDEVEVMV